MTALFVFLYRTHRKRTHAHINPQDALAHIDTHNAHAHPNTNDEAFSPSDSYASGFETKNEEDIVADTSGLHELEARKTPEKFVRGVHEMKDG